LLEREKFPREDLGESLLPFGYCLLEDLGVVDQLKENFVLKPGVRFIHRDGNTSTSCCFEHVIKDETYLSFQVIRGDFDHILLKNKQTRHQPLLPSDDRRPLGGGPPERL